jgi:hypothetical protein
MDKIVINVPRKEQNFFCKVCRVLIDVKKATPAIIETDTHIIHTWDYGHKHDKVYQIVGGKQYLVSE